MGCLQAEGAACGRELVFKGRHAAGEGSVGGMAVFVGRSESSTPIWQRPKGASPISASAVPVPAIPTAAAENARETEIMTLFAKGRNLAYIQEQLCLSKSTVSTHRQHIYQKLGVHSSQEMIDLIQEEKA